MHKNVFFKDIKIKITKTEKAMQNNVSRSIILKISFV